jgi:hypothetical protein
MAKRLEKERVLRTKRDTPLASRAEEAFGAGNLAACLGAKPVGAPWERSLIGKPQVTACGTTKIIRRQALAQPPGTFFRAISKHVGHDLAGAPAERNPQPTLALFFAAKASSRVHPTPARRLCGRAGVFRAAAGVPPLFFFPPSAAACDSRDQKCVRSHAGKAARWWRHGGFSRARPGS